MNLPEHWKNNLSFFCNKTPVNIFPTVMGEAILYGHVYQGLDKLLALLKSGNLECIKTWLPRCEGSFALFIKDRDQNKIHLVSDKWASKNFFVCPKEKKISDRLEGCAPAKRVLNKKAAAEFLTFYGFLQGDKTLIKDVFKIQPSTWYSISLADSHIISEEYWRPSFKYSVKTPSDNTMERLSKAWFDTFDDICLWIGSRKVICPISAGMDSRAILAELARRGLQQQVTTFTFSLNKSFELKVAEEVAESLGFKHIHLLIDESEISKPKAFSEMAKAHDFQIWNTPYVPASLHRKMGEYGDILLSGFGGDPLMGSHLARGDISLHDYLFDKYRWLHKEELDLQPITRSLDVSEDMRIQADSFDTGSLLTDYDAWYLFQRNTNMTQHGVLGHRDCYEIILPFMDSRIVDAVSDMSPVGREGRLLFQKLMMKLYPKIFSLKSSAQKGKCYEVLFSIERVIAYLSRRLIGKSLINNSFDYKPDLNEFFRRDSNFREIVTSNAYFLAGIGLLNKEFIEGIVESLLKGVCDGVHGQQRFPVMCAMSSLAVNIRELRIELA